MRGFNSKTIADIKLKLVCGDSIRHKLSIHVSHIRIGLNNFSVELVYLKVYELITLIIVDNKTMKVFCGDFICHKLFIHVSHIEIGVKIIFEIFEVSQFLVSKKFYIRGSRHIYSESTFHEEQ